MSGFCVVGHTRAPKASARPQGGPGTSSPSEESQQAAPLFAKLPTTPTAKTAVLGGVFFHEIMIWYVR